MLRLAPQEGVTQIQPDQNQGYLVSKADEGKTVDFLADANPTAGAISGAVYRDLFDDGVRDPGSQGFNGMFVYIDKNQNGQRDADEQTSITDSNGAFDLTNVLPGPHTIRVEPYLDIEPSSVSGSQQVTLTADQHLTDINLGMTMPADRFDRDRLALSNAMAARREGINAQRSKLNTDRVDYVGAVRQWRAAVLAARRTRQSADSIDPGLKAEVDQTLAVFNDDRSALIELVRTDFTGVVPLRFRVLDEFRSMSWVDREMISNRRF
jgi:hypothetical protein